MGLVLQRISFHSLSSISVLLSLPCSIMPDEKMGRDDESADSQSRSRQARIRDNQRRSRARRQEHLQDLERRLSECHVICREAELQKTAYKELQVENARLRQLLELLGVNPALINTFLAQDPAQSQSGNGPLRQLRPKMPVQSTLHAEMPSEEFQFITTGAEQLRAPTTLTSLSTTSSSTPILSTSPANYEPVVSYPAQHPATTSIGSSPFWGTSKSQSFPPQQHQTQTGHLSVANANYFDNSFRCMVFGNKACGPLQPSNESSTVLCSLAKEIIDQYNIEGEDFERIKSRLATGFAPPTSPGESCRVNNQLLFEVLNDISGRMS